MGDTSRFSTPAPNTTSTVAPLPRGHETRRTYASHFILPTACFRCRPLLFFNVSRHTFASAPRSPLCSKQIGWLREAGCNHFKGKAMRRDSDRELTCYRCRATGLSCFMCVWRLSDPRSRLHVWVWRSSAFTQRQPDIEYPFPFPPRRQFGDVKGCWHGSKECTFPGQGDQFL